MTLAMVVTMLPTFAITANAASRIDDQTLFDYDFTGSNTSPFTESVTSNSTYNLTLNTTSSSTETGGASYYSFTRGYLTGQVPNISSSGNNTDWSMQIRFNMTDTGATDYKYLLGLRNDTQAPRPSSGKEYFGLTTTGKLVYGHSNIIADVTSFTVGTTYDVIYTYKNQIFDIYVNGALVYSYNVSSQSTYKSLLENVVSVAIGGQSSHYGDMNLYYFRGTSRVYNFGYVNCMTSSDTTGVSGTATWDSTMNAWKFEGSEYMKLNETPLKSVTPLTGFAISFDVYNSDNGLTNKYFNFTDGTASISMDGSHGDWWKRYRTEISNGTNTRGYYTSDFTDSSYCDPTAPNNGNDTYPTGTWYRMTVVMNPDGSYSYYKDWNLVATFKSNYISTGNGGGLTDESAAASVAGATDYIIGASDTSGTDGFTGYIKNVKVIGGVSTGSAGQLALLIDKYETKMNGTVYTNMAAAYKAYVDANEALDAYIYGESTTAQISAAYSALNTAINNMSVWSAYTGTSTGYIIGSNASGAYSNILYCSDSCNWSNNNDWTGCGYLNMKATAPSNVVMYYDGVNDGNGVATNCYFPVAFEAYNTGNNGSNRRITYVYISSAAAGYNGQPSTNDAPYDTTTTLMEDWHGYHQGWEYPMTWTDLWQTTYPFGYYIGDTDNYQDLEKKSGGGPHRYWANKAYYKGTSNLSKSSLTFEMYNGDRNACVGMTVSSNVYVVDYAQLKTAISNKSAWLGRVTNYKEGGLLSLLEKYDNATSFNLTQYRAGATAANNYQDGSVTAVNDSNAGAYYTYANAACTKFAQDINNASITADNASNYIALRNAFDYKGNPTALHNSDSVIKNNEYTVRELIENDGRVDTNNDGVRDKALTGYDTLLTRYNEAVAVMAALGTAGYNTNTVGNYSNGSGAATAATNLLAAFNALTISDLNKPFVSGQVYLGPADTLTVTDTNEGDATYTWQYSTNGGSTWTDGASVASAGGTFAPFSNSAVVTAATDQDNTNNAVLIRVKAVLGSATDYDNPSGVEHRYYLAPTASAATDAVLAANATITLTNSASGLNGEIHYQISNDDGTTWSADTVYNGAFSPFVNGTKARIKAWEVSTGGSTSAELVVDNVRMATNVPVIYGTNGTENNLIFLDGNDQVAITNNDAGATTKYNYSGDGGTTWTSNQTYSGPITPFVGDAAFNQSSYTIEARSERHGAVSANSAATTFYHLVPPTITRTSNGNEITASANKKLAPGETVTLNYAHHFTGDYGTIKFRVEDLNSTAPNAEDRYLNDGNWEDYKTTGAFNPFTRGSAHATYVRIHAVQFVSNGTISGERTVDVVLNPTAPKITLDGAYVDKNHGATITRGDSDQDDVAPTLQYQISSNTDSSALDSGAWQTVPSNGRVLPFASRTDYDNEKTYYIHYRSTRTLGGLTSTSAVSYSQVTYIPRPALTITSTGAAPSTTVNDYDELTATDTLTLTEQGTSGGTMQYSINGGAWTDYSSAFAPFAIETGELQLTVKARIVYPSSSNIVSVSEETPTYTLIKKLGTATMYFMETGSETPDTEYYNANGKFFVDAALDAYRNKAIYYQASADGGAYGAYTQYDWTNGIASSTYGSNEIVTFKFYIIQNNGKTSIATGTFVKEGLGDLIYHETFNGTASGTTYTKADAKGVNLDLGSYGSIVSAAGDKNGPPGRAAIDNTTQDYRKNVLKLAAYTGGEVYVSMASNPLSTAANATRIKRSGATISFWRANETAGTDTQESIGFKSSSSTDDYKRSGTNQKWKNAIAFRQGDANSSINSYYMIEFTGTNSFITSSGNYVDVDPDNQEATTTAASSVSGYWEHVAITINPNAATLDDAIIVYLNGVPHSTTITPHGTYNSSNTVSALIDYITDSNTSVYFGHDNVWDNGEHTSDIYLDDVRVYAKPLTQKEIWESYYDDYSDASTIGGSNTVNGNKFSVTHDPTNVTVYKLTSAVDGVAANSLVGQEFIDYHNVPSSNYTIDSYYSFGTGMQIYKSNDNINWQIVGDRQGRVAYQNHDIFCRADGTALEYHTALSEALTKIDSLMSDPAAGNLVWAPHVMYNVSTNKWMMYVAISCWGDCQSTIIAMESADGSLEHFKARDNSGNQAYSFVVKSTSRPNAIDACPFYGHTSSGAIDPNTLYMTYGAWSEGESKTEDICVMSLNTSGMADSSTANGTLNTWNSCFDAEGGTRIASSQYTDGTGEGSFVVYKSNAELGLTAEDAEYSSTGGYYYMYASYGENTAGYNLRVYRSIYPDRNFVDMGNVSATETGQDRVHGTSFMRPFYNSDCQYVYMSTGHNSVYNAVNNYGEPVVLNATHARPLSSDDNGWVAIPDAAMATRQVELSGNVMIVNPVYYTQGGWPTPMPLQYNGTDTTKYVGNKHKAANEFTYTASDLEGYYDGNIIDSFVGEYAKHHTFNIVAMDVTKGAIVDNNTSNGYTFELTYGKINGSEYNNVTYINLYNSSHTKVGEGVIANHSGKPMFSIVHYDGRHTWGVWDKVYPRDVVNPEGIHAVEIDSVVYTHKANDEYSKYGQQISDNDLFLTDSSSGERVTTIKVAAPYYIDRSDPNAIACLNDAKFVSQGYTAGKYEVEPIKYVTSSGADYSSEEDYKENCDSEGGYILYKLTGSVSNFFAYRNGAYQEKGLELLIQYTNKEGDKYGEYKFPYVMANPAWAHTMAATKNTNSEVGNNRQSSFGIFNRFQDSYGEATDVSSSTLYWSSKGNTDETGWGTGVSTRLSDFSTGASFSDTDLDTLGEIQGLFSFYDANTGVNAGSFAAWTHNDTAPNSYTATPQLINTNYYIDYSDTKQYQNNNSNGLITVNGSGVPTGYQFKMRTSNFLWANYSGSSIFDTTSYAKNTTGLTVTYSSSYENEIGQSSPANLKTYDRTTAQDNMTTSGVFETNYDTWRTNVSFGGKRWWFDSEMLFHTDQRKNSNAFLDYSYRNAFLKHFTGKTTMTTQTEYPYDNRSEFEDGYMNGVTERTTPPSFYDYRDMTAYRTASNGKASTNAWQGTATFTGKDTLKQNTTATLQAIANADSNDSITYSGGRLYDGYYYYKDTGNADNREFWAATETEATTNKDSGKSHGQLDVTAENLANYILEMGNYHKITDTGVDGGRFLGSETYHYYNIGVDTCDKGAVREMVDTWANNKMNITRVDGRITTITGTGDGGAVETINASDYTVSSYNDYLDAIAEAYWFINNPRNTTYTSSVDGNEYAYSTAYGTFYGAKHASIYTDDEGDNIFGNTTPADDAYSADGKVHTDEVQAKIIANVIEAYENLFNIDDYTGAEDTYGKVVFKDAGGQALDKSTADVDDVTEIDITDTNDNTEVYSNTGYTEDSWTNFVTLIKDVSEDFDYYTNDTVGDEGFDRLDTDVDYWRYTPLTGSEYRKLLGILSNADQSLMPIVDTASLNTNYTHKLDSSGTYNAGGEQTLKTPIRGGETEYTYDSWKAMYDKVKNGEASLATALTSETTYSGTTDVKVSDGTSQTFTHGRYKVTGITAYKFGSNETFYKQDFLTTPFNEDGSSGVTKYNVAGNCSNTQKQVYQDSEALANAALTEVDDADAYNAYNTAYAVAKSVDRNKYTTAGINKLQEALDTRNQVYTTIDDTLIVDDDDHTALDIYKAYSGDSDADETTVFKKTTDGETDPITSTLLEYSNELELVANKAEYVKQIDVSYTITKDGTQLSTNMITPKPYYGDAVSFSVASDKAAADSVKYSVQKYEKYENSEFVNPTGATKVNTNGDSISQIVNTPMAVTAIITTGGTGSENVKVSIQNVYGKLIDVQYADANYPVLESSDTVLKLGSERTYTAPAVAFYTFEKWIEVDDGDGNANTKTYRAQYTVDGSMCSFSVVDGELTNEAGGTVERAKRDTKITLTYDDESGDTFYAWASLPKKSDAENLPADSCYDVQKYQIVSYSPTYWFYATTDEDFYPVIKSGGDYYVKTDDDEVELTADLVDSVTYIDFTGMTEAEKGELKNTILKSKLDSHSPFISISYAKVTTENVSGTNKNRFTATMRTTYWDNSGNDQKNDLTGASMSTVFARKYSSYINQNKGEYLFIKGASGVTTIKITNVLDNGQFEVTATYPLTDTGKAAIRGCVEYPLTYTYNGDSSTVTLCDYTTINPLTYLS